MPADRVMPSVIGDGSADRRDAATIGTAGRTSTARQGVAYALRCQSDQALAATGSLNGAPRRLNAFIAAIVIVRSTRSFGSNASAAAA